ncbi:4'-phosphopantetheinyl transferase superfamily protein [Fibrella sp. WM1]|uniref:4'-phosphopantetheinyl transferase family protein n=1 Tax=Fibrella musci TaxID=3242485 RepID=UPI00351F91C6
MPLLSTDTLSPDCQLVRWQITEDEPTLAGQLVLTADEQADLDGITHPGQRVEWLACRVALKSLIEDAGFPYMGLYKDEWGKPHLYSSVRGTFLPGHVSLSHTPGWAVAAWHFARPIGVDVEPIRDQFTRVVPRVLSATEIADANGQPDRLAVYWCAKEAMYKLYGKRQLTFREHLLVDSFASGATQLTGHVRLPDAYTAVTIHCQHVEPGLVAVAY